MAEFDDNPIFFKPNSGGTGVVRGVFGKHRGVYRILFVIERWHNYSLQFSHNH